MAAAANFAWVNRSCMTYCVRQAFSRVFKMSPDDLDMQVVFIIYAIMLSYSDDL